MIKNVDLTSPSHFKGTVIEALKEKSMFAISEKRMMMQTEADTRKLNPSSASMKQYVSAAKKAMARGDKETAIKHLKVARSYAPNFKPNISDADGDELLKLFLGESNDDNEEDEPLSLDVYFAEDDIPAAIVVAKGVGIEYTIDDDEEFEITTDDEELLDMFFDELDKQNIPYQFTDENPEDDESISEAFKKLVRIKPADKLARKADYRKHKNQIKLNAKKFRKTTKFKKYKVKAKRLAKTGKTSTGKKQVRRA
ncbi:MAG: hypothetical protein R8M45_10660 [Ghiorsea sp.]